MDAILFFRLIFFPIEKSRMTLVREEVREGAENLPILSPTLIFSPPQAYELRSYCVRLL
jgi:hypothetical protein